MSSALVGAIVVGNMALAVVVLGHVVQRSERSKFRYCMWQIRDRLLDEISAGRLERHPKVSEYLDRLSFTIDAAELITPFRLIGAARIIRAADVPLPVQETYVPESTDAQQIMAHAQVLASRARARLFFYGSPSGWFLILLSPIVAFWAVCVDKIRKPQSITQEMRQPRLLEDVAVWVHVRYGSIVDVLRCWLWASGKGLRHSAYT